MPDLVLISAFPLRKEIVGRLESKIKRLAGKTADLKLQIDPQIGGGAVFEWQGKYLDLSLRKKVQKTLKTNF